MVAFPARCLFSRQDENSSTANLEMQRMCQESFEKFTSKYQLAAQEETPNWTWECADENAPQFYLREPHTKRVPRQPKSTKLREPLKDVRNLPSKRTIKQQDFKKKQQAARLQVPRNAAKGCLKILH